MRWIHLTVIALFAVATLVFAMQNLQTVTMAFLGFSVRLPLALQAVVIYLLGMVTGGSLLALLRRSLEGSRRTASPP
jgi:putative membrane protein